MCKTCFKTKEYKKKGSEYRVSCKLKIDLTATTLFEELRDTAGLKLLEWLLSDQGIRHHYRAHQRVASDVGKYPWHIRRLTSTGKNSQRTEGAPIGERRACVVHH